MPLPKPEKRAHIQTREISVYAFRREDGQWNSEGQLKDSAAIDIPNVFNKRVPAKTTIHDMKIRSTLDMESHPYAICPLVLPSFKKLKAEAIAPGWNSKLKRVLGGVKGCIHIVDLLWPMGTIGFKTVQREAITKSTSKTKQTDFSPNQGNSCQALSSTGPIVKKQQPDLYRGK